MHKKVAPRKGCVDTIYSDINRGFYDIPRKPFSPPLFTKTKLLLGVLFFSQTLQNPFGKVLRKRGTLFGTPVFSPIFLSFLRQTRCLSKVNGGKRGIPPNLFPVPQIVRMPIRTHDVLSYSCYSSSLFLSSSNIACMVGLSLVSFLMLMSSTLLLAIRSWLSDPCSSLLTFCR